MCACYQFIFTFALSIFFRFSRCCCESLIWIFMYKLKYEVNVEQPSHIMYKNMLNTMLSSKEEQNIRMCMYMEGNTQRIIQASNIYIG